MPPRELVVADLEFGRDLLTLRMDAEGKSKPESPSSLETLMVSGLAWLLRRLEAEPLGWAPECTNPAAARHAGAQRVRGPVSSRSALPAREEIPARVEALLEEVLRHRAPFLRSSQWEVERRHFAALTIQAAQAWRDMLERLGAEVVAAEEWLGGTWSGIAVHGQTDLMLGLPDDRLLVVDYKRSKSTQSPEADAEGVRQPGDPVPGDARERWAQGSPISADARGAARNAAGRSASSTTC